MRNRHPMLQCLPLTVGFLLVFSAPTLGFDFQDGVHGMSWASLATEHDHLTKVRDAGALAYYINANMTYNAANQPVPGVIYGFFEGKLFAVYIKLRSPDQFHHMEKRFSARYGPALIKTSNAGDQTIYRWKNNDTKIKLKIKESSQEIKLGIYYTPLSNRVNQEKMEDVPPGTFPDTPPADKPAGRSAPLL